MVRRFVGTLKNGTMKNCETYKEIENLVTETFQTWNIHTPWFANDEVEELIHSLLTIQFVNGVSAEDDVSKGNLHYKVKTNLGLLTCEDCIVIAKEAMYHNFLELGYQWTVAAEEALKNNAFKVENSAEIENLWQDLLKKTELQTKKLVHREFRGKFGESLKNQVEPVKLLTKVKLIVETSTQG